MVGPLLVPDDRLAEVGRPAGPEPIAVRVLVAGGAGGLLALSRRTAVGVRVVGAVSVLRDLDDLAGNAARVVAAAEALDESVQVLVELPDAPGWPAAAELVEAAGLAAQVRSDRSPDALIEQLAVLVEIDLPFSVAGSPGSLSGLLLAVDTLVETGDTGPAARLLTGDDHRHPAARLRALSATRIRLAAAERRLPGPGRGGGSARRCAQRTRPCCPATRHATPLRIAISPNRGRGAGTPPVLDSSVSTGVAEAAPGTGAALKFAGVVSPASTVVSSGLSSPSTITGVSPVGSGSESTAVFGPLRWLVNRRPVGGVPNLSW